MQFESSCLISTQINTLIYFKDSPNEKIHSVFKYRHLYSNFNVAYLGQTSCHSFTRAAKNMGVPSLTGKQFKNVKDSVVSDHLLMCKYTIDFKLFNILTTDISKFHFLVKENLLIKGYICYEIIFYYKAAFDLQLMNFFI